MKTFKLISLQIVEGADLKDIELQDGLIINKEDDLSSWLIEAYISKSYLDYFKSGDEMIVQVVISKKENGPATFQTKVHSVKEFDKNMSVLLEGTLKSTRNAYAELVLDDLLKKGMSGDNLLSEFKEKMKSRPRLAVIKKV
ncbi:YwpF-like family protein [Bacillus methanolicus]|uniref:YwpF-like protein n=1 Tax=Bacillus methanolicus (strain MGA3 / ATCC 53907) TaxID=796606 RepID=I3EBG6_BACMM|nr:YwpF-like family protein [Bacillus methanolicus]AIE61518.1 hypothetical protein BMMGA3_15825 [Bacillus methanolicus MGA3]EIJ83837.1 hypothetical protein MGA3_01040 [Bacillus methanolicus MGA3]